MSTPLSADAVRSSPAHLPLQDQPDPVTGGATPPQHELTHARGPVQAVAR
jgi:hypothetical protein